MEGRETWEVIKHTSFLHLSTPVHTCPLLSAPVRLYPHAHTPPWLSQRGKPLRYCSRWSAAEVQKVVFAPSAPASEPTFLPAGPTGDQAGAFL